MKRSTEDGYMRTNREMSKEPRNRGWWCWGCDGNLVRGGQVCSVCKSRMMPYRAKKTIVRD